MRITICFENLCPVYPGRSSVCHDPLSVRDLLRRVDSPAVGMLLDIGHAHVVAGFMGVETSTLVEPVLGSVRLFHVHDNFGARLRGAGAARRSTRSSSTCTCRRASGTCRGTSSGRCSLSTRRR